MSGPVEWAEYREALAAIGIRREAADAADAQWTKTTNESVAERSAIGDQALHQLDLGETELTALLGAATAMLPDDLGGPLEHLPAAGAASPLDLDELGGPDVDGAMDPIRAAVEGLPAKVAALESAERHAAWTRRRTVGLARDVVLLPVAFVPGIAFLVYLYFSAGEDVGPVLATIWTAIVAAVVAVVVTIGRSWIFARLDGADWIDGTKHGRGGAARAAMLLWGISMILYGPAPRPFRDGLEKIVFGWLDSVLVVGAPVVGVALCVMALLTIQRLFSAEPSVKGKA
ncbi:hypothetical protein FHR83_008673 [Actinoplanes campanulatus]|uniref:Uncharacterized protein n=1 Tax=Actinoplanes campanulatus TaxID=113559 RepID=A0A7W5FJS0_9ACTN|nr:hypothetical protein [Actinoplanes campanulatus]MBB3100946.1 hypothetical protein [Actinoplanes campanulatus]